MVEALDPLLDYAMAQLEHVSDAWSTFPIFLKATAGMRELPLDQRVAIMTVVRKRKGNETRVWVCALFLCLTLRFVALLSK